MIESGHQVRVSLGEMEYMRGRWEREELSKRRRARFWWILWGFSIGVLFAALLKMPW